MTRQRRVAIVGAGPSGLFAAQALATQDRLPVRIDLFERLPTPYGLLRYGVAPDHENIKAVARALASTFDHGDVSFWGLVEFGHDVTRAELLAGYDAVIYAVGAAQDIHLQIPGENLSGSRSAREFVAWYGGHPDARPQNLSGVTGAAAIGVGNVAIDVARVLLKDPTDLERTDMPPGVLEELHAADVRDVWIVGRRGPEHASYTTKELRELVGLPGVQVLIDPAALDAAERGDGGEGAGGAGGAGGARVAEGAGGAGLDRRVRGNLEVLREAAQRSVPDADRRLHFVFWRRPVCMHSSDGRLRALDLERTTLDESGSVVGTGHVDSIEAQLVLRAVGYRATPLPDVPFDTAAAIVPNVEGRVVDDSGSPLPGEYCTGWVKRGPIGVIGTNKSDAAQTVGHLLDDLAAETDEAAEPAEAAETAEPAETAETAATAEPAATAGPGLDVIELLRGRGHAPSTLADWRSIDAAEVSRGESLGRARTKLSTWHELLAHVDVEREAPAGVDAGAVDQAPAQEAGAPPSEPGPQTRPPESGGESRGESGGESGADGRGRPLASR